MTRLPQDAYEVRIYAPRTKGEAEPRLVETTKHQSYDLALEYARCSGMGFEIENLAERNW